MCDIKMVQINYFYEEEDKKENAIIDLFVSIDGKEMNATLEMNDGKLVRALSGLFIRSNKTVLTQKDIDIANKIFLMVEDDILKQQ